MRNNTVVDNVVLKALRDRIGCFECTCYCGGFGSPMVLLSDIDRVMSEFAAPLTLTPTNIPSREWLTRMAEAEAQCPSITAGTPDAAASELERVAKERDAVLAEVGRVKKVLENIAAPDENGRSFQVVVDGDRLMVAPWCMVQWRMDAAQAALTPQVQEKNP